MKFIKAHIIFLLTAVSFLTATVDTPLSLEVNSFLIETEIEEAFDEEVESCSVFKDISVEKSSDGDNAIVTLIQSVFSDVYFNIANSYIIQNKPLANKVAYFILYCCLKVNC